MHNTLYLFRHGLATKNTNGYGDQIKSAQLLPEGVQQAAKIGEYLKQINPDAFYSSEYLRCTQTATIVSNIIHYPFIKDHRLNEFDEITFPKFVKQIQSFLTEISQKHNQIVFICSHAGTFAIFKKLLFQEVLTKEDVITNNPATGVLQIIENNTIKEIDLNKNI